MAEGTPGEGIMRGPMLRRLLEDRFHLKVHRETRQVPTYLLTVVKSGSPSDPAEGIPIFTAIKQQLGLKLESGRGPRGFLIIDHVDRPTEN